MAAFCLPKELTTIFRQKLKDGTIDPNKLATMTSEQRNTFFTDFLGKDNATQVNSLFESKLLLKDQQRGMITWAKKIAGLKEPVKNDLISKINKMDKILNPADEKAFLHDLASTRLGTNVTLEESKKIFDLSQKAEQAKSKMNQDPTNKNRIAYGNAYREIIEYKSQLLGKKAPLITNILNLPRSLVASLDFVSAPFRHGWGMTTRANFWKNYANMPRYAFSEKAFQDKMADIYSRPTYQTMQDAKLRITSMGENLTKREEQFMSSILDHFPITRGSARAYMGFLNGLRADMFDQFLRSAELLGEDTKRGSQVTKDIANVVNNFTGGANLPFGLEHIDPILNTFLFSPRKQMATMQMLNPINYINPKISPTARKEALRNILGSVGATAAILTMASLAGLKVETDPRSTDFGQIRIGDTRLDLTGGNRTYATLIARLITGKSKSATTGVVTTLGKGYKATTRMDLFTQFVTNKLSPTASFFADWLNGKTGLQPFDIKQEILQRVLPMNITDAMDLMNNDKSNAAMGIMLNLFGVPVTSYTSGTQWTQQPSVKLQQFEDKVGTAKFTQANQEYNTEVTSKLQLLQNNEKFKSLSSQDQQTVITKMKTNVENKIFQKYSFHYRTQRNSRTTLFKQLSQ